MIGCLSIGRCAGFELRRAPALPDARRKPDMDEPNFVEYAVADRIATITLNRPDKLNAVSDEVVAQLADALRRFDLDEEAEVAILNGKGRAFSSGADVRQRQLRSRDEFEKLGGPQGWGTNSADLLTRCGQLEAGHRRGARLCAGAGARPDPGMRPDRRRRGHPLPVDRDLARARRLALLGACSSTARAGAFGDEIALTGRFFTAEEGSRPGCSTGWRPRASISKWRANWRCRSRKTRRWRCARRCGRGAGTCSGWCARRSSSPSRSSST